MNNAIFVGSLYVAAVLVVFVAISGMVAGVPTMTLVLRMALTLVTFAFLGWLAETILKKANAPTDPASEDAETRGAVVDVVLPATDEE